MKLQPEANKLNFAQILETGNSQLYVCVNNIHISLSFIDVLISALVGGFSFTKLVYVYFNVQNDIRTGQELRMVLYNLNVSQT